MVSKHSLHVVTNQNRSRCRCAHATKDCEKGPGLISDLFRLPCVVSKPESDETNGACSRRRPWHYATTVNQSGLKRAGYRCSPATTYSVSVFFHAQSRRAERRPFPAENGASPAGPSSIRARDQAKGIGVSGTSARPLPSMRSGENCSRYYVLLFEESKEKLPIWTLMLHRRGE